MKGVKKMELAKQVHGRWGWKEEVDKGPVLVRGKASRAVRADQTRVVNSKVTKGCA